ncbi:hypothetical protein [Streptomyces sp. NPDC018031]|uniref:hypothetical protein n=1 Tax=Streptomyces sp. NPDC018031 TaxID=3365033 RepID=UPI0037BACC02
MPAERYGDTAWRSVPREKTVVHSLPRAPMNDPEHVLRQVARTRGFTKAGEETVAGAPVVRYRGKLTHDTLTLRMARDMRAKLDTGRRRMGGDIPVLAEVWIDRSGHVVRTRFTCDMGSGGVAAGMDFTDIGKPVRRPGAPDDAQPVPADEAGGPLLG